MEWSIRNISGYLLANLLIALGFVRRAREKAMKGEFLIAVYFHKPSKIEFEKCILWLKKHRFNIISTDELHAILHNNLPFPKGAIVLTVDDGWQTNEFNIVDVANQNKVPVTIFVSTEPVEEGAYWWSYIKEAKNQKFKVLPVYKLKRLINENRLKVLQEVRKFISIKREALTVEQIIGAAKSEYITIGGHTHSHPILTNCLSEELYNELAESKHKIEAWIEKDVFYFAYPNGDFGEREKFAVKDLKYRLAFTCYPAYIKPEQLTDNFTLPRFGFLEDASFAENICRISGVWFPVTNKIKSIFVKRKQLFIGTDKTKVLSFS